MSVLSGIERLLRRRGSEPPRFTEGARFQADVEVDDSFTGIDEILDSLDVADDEDLSLVTNDARSADLLTFWESTAAFGEHAAGTVFGIEYASASGRRTLRRIRLHRLYWDGQLVYLRAYCFERKAARTFRLDRIRSVFDMDGVVHEDAIGFLRALGVEIDAASATTPSPEPVPERSGMAARRVARDGLRLLVALARSDGFLHEEELEVVRQYIVHRAEHEGVFATDEDLVALDGYLRRQYPSDEVVSRCLCTVEKETPEQQRLFLRHAMALADADGVQHEAEFRMLMELQERLGT